MVQDRDLWSRSAEGDSEAFAELFARHTQRVWNHAYRLTGSWDQAEDLTSATFLLAWRRRGAVVLVHDSALPWLYTVVGNLVREHGRSSRRRQRLLHRLRPPEPVDDHANHVADRMIGQSLRHALALLPDAQRRAVELCLVAELSTSEAAAALGVSEATVRSNLSRGRARLREHLSALRPGRESTS